jgi:hypothetical protein
MIEEISHIDIIRLMRQNLELPLSDDIDEVLLASIIRRLASFQCPCSLKTLLNEAKKSLKSIISDDEEFSSVLENVINRLIVNGDLLELNDVVTNDINVKGTWLFAAPPSFVTRQNGIIYIFGIVPDENIPLASLADRIRYEGCKRILVPKENENLSETLVDFGLSQISSELWLKTPKVCTYADHLKEMDKRLSSAEPANEIRGLTVLDKNSNVRNYRSRWKQPTSQSGRFVAKRPQKFGSDTWCYAELDNGKLLRFVDIPTKFNGITQRECDGAWLLQMAIDADCGQPQEYSLKSENQENTLAFYSPIPKWAERRLTALGRLGPATNCLFSYIIPESELTVEESFLKAHLWLNQK